MGIDLRDRNAVVTGGSIGIGREICLQLARSGACVVFGYRSNESSANDLVDEIEKEGGKALCVGGDVRRRETLEELFRLTRESFGPVDIAIANAGIWKRAPIEEMSEADWRETLETNLWSVYHLCHLAAAEMKTRKRGHIVLIGSTAGQRGEAFHSHYAASKGAIHAMTKSLGAELGPYGIHVNCVAPGWVETPMNAEVFSDASFKESLEEQAPLGRIATPEQIASAALFLVSDLAANVQGEILNVNGGSVMCG